MPLKKSAAHEDADLRATPRKKNGSAPKEHCRKDVVGEDRKPGSVPDGSYPPPSSDHSSRAAVADGLKRPNPGTSDGPSSNVPLFGLAPDGVYLAFDVAAKAGELLPHPFTLTCRCTRR